MEAAGGPVEIDRTVHGLTELRVHGVSGTPPEQMLFQPRELIKRVAGTGAAGFWRRWYPGGRTDDQPEVRHLEAYGWGPLTSGPATRALWLLLVPFTLVNVAHWMLPPQLTSRAFGAVAAALLRLLGLSLTLMMLITSLFMASDIAAWQCAALPACESRMGPFRMVAEWDLAHRLAVAATLPALLILLLWWLGRADLRDRRLGPRRTSPTPPPSPGVRRPEVPLSDPDFWVADRSTPRLRAAHVVAWAAALGGLVLIPCLRYETSTAVRGVAAVLVAAQGALLVVAVVLTAWNRATGRGGPGSEHLDRPVAAARLAALLLMGASIVLLLTSDLRSPPVPSFAPGLRESVYLLLGVQVALLLALLLVVAAGRPWVSTGGRSRPGFTVALFGFGAPVTALLGWLVGGALSVGSGLWLTRFLGVPVASTKEAADVLAGIDQRLAHPTGFEDQLLAASAKRPLIVPPPYFWAAAAAVVVVLALTLALLWTLLRVYAGRPALVREIQGEHRTELGGVASLAATTESRAVANRWAMAALTDRLGRLLGVLATVAALVMVAGTITYLARGYQLAQDSWLVVLTTPGISLIALAAAGTVSLGFLAFRTPEVRRTVGIVWDVATFWPRANHPLTPPSYGERAVPDLVRRIGELTTCEADRVVLSGHSQGSVLSAATLLQLRGDPLDRTALLTYGAPLRRLYARYFPAYFGASAMDRLADRAAPCWVNLWARSDPIGGWARVQSAVGDTSGVDVQLLDPLSLAPADDGTPPTVCGHSGFFARAEYTAAVDALGRCR
jgi:hypothetical protein